MRNLEKNILNLYGDRGMQWLGDLDQLVTDIKAEYGLSNLKPVEHLSHHYVLSGFQGEQPVIVKVGLSAEGLKQEATALRAFDGFGAAKVLEDSKKMLLLERAVPGASLKAHFPKKDLQAVQIACTCLKRLHQAPLPYAHTFPHIRQWLAVLDQQWDIKDSYLAKARQLRDNLLATAQSPVLLHGDLHHDNILKNGHGWLIIDPKGVMGEAAYDVAAFIRNPIPELLELDNAASIIQERIALFSKTLELPQQRILNWCFVQAVLAWAWALEDNSDTSNFEKLTKIFDQLQL